jgi:AraC family transcriptional regulator of adaptative response/methylated-DNA-[protein]-cysteine methyltransferase
MPSDRTADDEEPGPIPETARGRSPARGGAVARLAGESGDARSRADRSVRRLIDACRRIESADGPIPIAALARGLGTGAAQLAREFRARLGVTPRAYAETLRLMRLASATMERSPATRRVLDAGFGSIGRGYAAAARSLGLPPGRLAGATEIGWWVALSDLGWMLIAATERGICRIAFGEDPDLLRAELSRAFPRARLRPDEARLRGWLEQVRERVLLPAVAVDLPLDLKGTAFQARVWAALREIPLGTTTTYSDLAVSLGMPTAARAVAAACAANPVAVLVPCHRVVARNGALAGYRWGLERKRTLLGRERDRGIPAGLESSPAIQPGPRRPDRRR